MKKLALLLIAVPVLMFCACSHKSEAVQKAGEVIEKIENDPQALSDDDYAVMEAYVIEAVGAPQADVNEKYPYFLTFEDLVEYAPTHSDAYTPEVAQKAKELKNELMSKQSQTEE